MNISRRAALAIGAAVAFTPFGAVAAESSCGGQLSMAQKNRRRALGYVDKSTIENKRCGVCVFFTKGSAECGGCQMLSGASVSGNAYCNSFVAK